VDFVCMATGGPCEYTGQDMRTAHAGMVLVEDEFNALVEDLVAALDKFKVPDREKNELLGALGPLKDEMVASTDLLQPVTDGQLETIKAAARKIPRDNQLAADIMAAAVVAAERGQRSYAEQLFSRVEIVVGDPKLVA